MKGLASDFDGTLYFSNIEGNYRKEDLDKIKAFQDKGYLFGICTGRPLIGIKKSLEGIIDLDFYILTTGALILDKNLNIIDEHLIDKNTLEKIYLMYKDMSTIIVQSDDVIYTTELENVNIVQEVITDIKDVKGKAYGISLNARDEENARRICKEIKYYFHDLDAFQNKEYIDVVRIGCSKGNALLKIKELLNIDTIAGIGDSYNDIPMLESADISFTFYSSPQIVKDSADILVNSISEAIGKL